MKRLALLEALVWPALLLTVGLVIVQAHAIPYWQARAGLVLGAVWSLGLEAAALWLLYRADWRAHFAGAAVALVLVAVPLWQVGQPALAEWTALQAAHDQRIAAEAEIASLEQSLRAYERNSAERTGWHSMIERTQSRLAELRAASSPLSPGRGAGGQVGWGWWRWVIELGPVALSLILFQAMNVAMVRQLARYRRADGNVNPVPTIEIVHAPAREPEPVHGGSQIHSMSREPSSEQGLSADEFTILRLQRRVWELIKASGVNAAEWGRMNGVHKRDLSYLLNHARLKKEGKRTLSEDKAAELAAKFLGTGIEAQS